MTSEPQHVNTQPVPGEAQAPREDSSVSGQPVSQIPLLLATVFLAYLGQMTLNPIIAPLAREVGLAEWQVGVTISTAAVMVVSSALPPDVPDVWAGSTV